MRKAYFYPPLKQNNQLNGALVLADGSVFWGKGAGAVSEGIGEICFNTSFSGYQEILTDPSYASQIITFASPHIGNVGTNIDDIECATPSAKGCIIREDISEPANWRSTHHFDNWLKKVNLPAVTGIDTRRLIRHIRTFGAQSGAIVHTDNKIIDTKVLLTKVRAWPGLNGMDLAKEVTCTEIYSWDTSNFSKRHSPIKKQDKNLHIAAIDYGIKQNILRCLANLGCKITVFPATSSADKILSIKPDGILLSNGPGDPSATGKYAIPTIKQLLKKNIPIFGICLGHQLLSLALGAKTKKMYLGHRGANQPIKNLETGQVEITSQNHGFVVERDHLPADVVETHRSLFDGVIEGIRVKNRPIFSVQYHPEASPGPHDSNYLFENFLSLIKKTR